MLVLQHKIRRAKYVATADDLERVGNILESAAILAGTLRDLESRATQADVAAADARKACSRISHAAKDALVICEAVRAMRADAIGPSGGRVTIRAGLLDDAHQKATTALALLAAHERRDTTMDEQQALREALKEEIAKRTKAEAEAAAAKAEVKTLITELVTACAEARIAVDAIGTVNHDSMANLDRRDRAILLLDNAIEAAAALEK